MTKRAKMCKYHGTRVHPQSIVNGKCNMVPGAWCPKNVNAHCQIITKRKAKLVKVRAWASVLEAFRTGKREIRDVSLTKSITRVIPVTILIDRKYLKGKI